MKQLFLFFDDDKLSLFIYMLRTALKVLEEVRPLVEKTRPDLLDELDYVSKQLSFILGVVQSDDSVLNKLQKFVIYILKLVTKLTKSQEYVAQKI